MEEFVEAWPSDTCILQCATARIDELRRMFMTMDRNVLHLVAASHPARSNHRDDPWKRQGDGTLTVVEVKDALDKAGSHDPCPVFIAPLQTTKAGFKSMGLASDPCVAHIATHLAASIALAGGHRNARQHGAAVGRGRKRNPFHSFQ